MFRLSKYVAIIGIPILISSIVLLTWMYRLVAMNDLIHQSEEHNRILTKTIANAIWSQVDGLNNSLMKEHEKFERSGRNSNQFALSMISVMLDEPIKELLSGTKVLKVKIFNLSNMVIYSTTSQEVGSTESIFHVPLLKSKQGDPISEFEFKETFSHWNGDFVHNRHIVSSYLPVRDRSTQDIEGIIEIYSDVTNLYEGLQHSQLTFSFILAVVLLSIYSTVALTVKRLDRTLMRNIELTVARDSEKQSNVAKSQFLANMSHELRTPLNAIIGYSEIIEEDSNPEQSPETVQDVRKIQTAAHHLLHLINEILDLSKIEAGQMQVFKEDIDLYALVHEIVALVKPLMDNNNNSFEYDYQSSLDLIHTDALKLRQILLNLLSNAAKFCQNGSIGLYVHLDDNGLVVEVTDTGIGMSEHQIDILFQPFVQADESTTRKYGGTGLGLTITKQYSEMLGGVLSVNSVQDCGSKFSLKIPASELYCAESHSKTPAYVLQTRGAA